jgi:alkyl sulfatase BDS1-like metallo-beta-lactamase superfamily hydrolase
VIAQRANAECQRDDARIRGFRQRRSFVFFAKVIEAAIRAMRDAGPSVQSTPTPTILVDDRHAFAVGGLELELLAVPGGETVDALCVWLPQHGIAIVGNQFGALFPHVPNLCTVRGDRYRFVEPYLASLDRILALEPAMLVTGHFAPIVGKDLIRTELVRLRDAVRYLHDATLAGMNAGTDVYTLMREIKLPPALEIGEGYGKVDWAVRTIVESYGGWFHFRSTTELYPSPVADVHADLVALAGGADAVAARAAARVASGDPLHAIHLAEVALGVEPKHRPALDAYLAAHELLLARGGHENFWEAGWLRHQIATTRQTLADLDGVR